MKAEINHLIQDQLNGSQFLHSNWQWIGNCGFGKGLKGGMLTKGD